MNVYLLSYTEQINMTDDEHLDALVHATNRMDNSQRDQFLWSVGADADHHQRTHLVL
ncbi:MAG: hypothetical protein M3Q87_03330 [Actinomycetota bacterium]|nr:hypothetical protein [Actinomycetota bacterium]